MTFFYFATQYDWNYHVILLMSMIFGSSGIIFFLFVKGSEFDVVKKICMCETKKKKCNFIDYLRRLV